MTNKQTLSSEPPASWDLQTLKGDESFSGNLVHYWSLIFTHLFFSLLYVRPYCVDGVLNWRNLPWPYRDIILSFIWRYRAKPVSRPLMHPDNSYVTLLSVNGYVKTSYR